MMSSMANWLDRALHGIRWRLDHLDPRRRLRQSRVWSDSQKTYSQLTIAETFDRIYADGIWGGGTAEIHSGPGSRGELMQAYCSLLRGEIEKRKILTLVDLGCGDFQVGSLLAGMVNEYTGVDVASEVIARNSRQFGSEHRRFFRLDLSKDPLPYGDAAVLRQVLQHLSNDEIQAVLSNAIRIYPLTFVTEHVTVACDKPNIDMAHGPLTRTMKGSGVYIDRPPFNIAVELLEDIPYWPGEVLRTWVVKGAPAG